jgi:hypothetical protein
MTTRATETGEVIEATEMETIIIDLTNKAMVKGPGEISIMKEDTIIAEEASEATLEATEKMEEESTGGTTEKREEESTEGTIEKREEKTGGITEKREGETSGGTEKEVT